MHKFFHTLILINSNFQIQKNKTTLYNNKNLGISPKKRTFCWTKYVFVKQNKFSSVRKIAYMRLQI